MKRAHQLTSESTVFVYDHYLTTEKTSNADTRYRELFVQTSEHANMMIPVFKDNEAKLQSLTSFANSKSPVSLKLNKMKNGEVCSNSKSEVGGGRNPRTYTVPQTQANRLLTFPLQNATINPTINITICHHHHHNHHHLSLSLSQPPPSVTIIITTTTIGHYHHHRGATVNIFK